MLRAPSARIQARRERETKAAEDAARGQTGSQDYDRQQNPMDNQVRPIRVNHRRAAEFESEVAYSGRDSNEDEETDEDYVAEEEEESEEVELESEKEDPEIPKPSRNDLVTVLTNQTRVLEELARTQQESRENAHGQEVRLSEFMKFKPPTFDSTDDPLEADDWLREINKKLDIVHATGRDRVLLASHQLVGSAAEWWDNYSQAAENPEEITWEEFQETFREYHIPEGIMEIKAEEFRNLKQGTMTVAQYIQKFMKLSRYAMDDVNTDKKKQDRFRKGLNHALKTQLITHIYPDFNTLMSKTILLEDAQSEWKNEKKRKLEAQKLKRQERSQRPHFNYPQKSRRQRNQQFKAPSSNPLPAATPTLGQSSVSQSKNIDGTTRKTKRYQRCFCCKDRGHMLADCPYKVPQSEKPIGSIKTVASGIGHSEPQTSGQRQMTMQPFSQSRVNNINVRGASYEDFGEFSYVRNPHNSSFQFRNPLEDQPEFRGRNSF
jgi:Retrotransposon gag protein